MSNFHPLEVVVAVSRDKLGRDNLNLNLVYLLFFVIFISLIFRMQWIFRNQDCQMFGLKLDKYH